jgi:hypothetical protein
MGTPRATYGRPGHGPTGATADAQSVMPYELAIPDPLTHFLRWCEYHCVAACCQLEAYVMDVKALAYVGQLLPDDFDAAVRQLDDLIAQTSAIDDAVASDPHFCYTWPTGAACADYLGQWGEALSSARSVPLRETDPQRRLARVGERNSESWRKEVGELIKDAWILVQFGHRERGIELMRMVLPLDDGGQSPLRMEFDTSREALARWTGSASDGPDRPASNEER